jgi:hypothetical protein
MFRLKCLSARASIKCQIAMFGLTNRRHHPRRHSFGFGLSARSAGHSSYTTARAGGRVAGNTNNLRVEQIANTISTAQCRSASRSDRIDPAREFCSPRILTQPPADLCFCSPNAPAATLSQQWKRYKIRIVQFA